MDTTEENDHPRRDEMILKVVRAYFGIRVKKVKDIPTITRSFLGCLKYVDIVTPLIIRDREMGLSYGQLSIKYGLTNRQVNYILCCKTIFSTTDQK